MKATGKSDGYVWRSIQCAHCDEATGWLLKVCNGALFGMIREDLEEHMNEIVRDRRLTLGRLIIGIRKQWRTRSGTLMPIPDVDGVYLEDVLDWKAYAARREARGAA